MSLKYMLDTNICIYLMNKRSHNVIDNVRANLRDGLCISSITLGELEYGASKSAYYERNIIAIQKTLALFNVLDFDDTAASCYGKVRAALERKGLSIGPLDTLIAAHALSKDLIVVTNNSKEFERVDGLRIEDWS